MSSRGRTSEVGEIRSHRRRLREWFLLNGHRLHVTGLTVVGLFACLWAIARSGLVPFENTQSLYYVFSGLIGGNLTVITVVVAINQLLLSRGFVTPNELQSQMEGVIEYRRDIEQMAGRTTPVDPPGFLRLLVESTRQDAQALGGLARTAASEGVYDEIDPVVTWVTAHADDVDALLDEPDTSTFETLSTMLTTNYASQITELHRIRKRDGDRIPADVRDAMDTLVQGLEDIDIARQYFKTIYLQEELATLSRLLFYVGLGSLVCAVTALFLFTASTGASVPRPVVDVVVAGLVTAGLVPISLLFAFILRISTVTQRTAATVPFTTPRQER